MILFRKLFMLFITLSITLLLGCEVTTGGSPVDEFDDGLSSDYFLKSLKFSSGTLKYPFTTEDWVNYLDVPFTTDSITVTAQLNQKWQTVYIGDEKLINNSPSNPIKLKVGLNTLSIRVVAEDGKELVYTIYITRFSENYSLAKLSVLAFDGIPELDPAFGANEKNRKFFFKTSLQEVTLNAVAAAGSEGATVETSITSGGTTVKVNDTSSIPLADGLNTITITSTAPDRKTKETYTITIVKQITGASSNLALLAIKGGSFVPEFTPANKTYSIDVSSTMNPVNLTAIPASDTAEVSVTVNDNPADLSPIPLTPGTVNTIKVFVTGSAVPYTITATALKGNDNAFLSGLTVKMGEKSFRPLHPGKFTKGSSDHDPNSTTFSRDTMEYVTVIYGFSTIELTATAEDNTVKSIQFSTGGEAVSSSFDSGVGTAAIPLKYGEITPIEITILAGDGTSKKTYTVYAKLLNIDEFYWGMYSPSMAKAKDERWNKPSGTSKLYTNGLVSGRLEWQVEVKLPLIKSWLRFQNDYNDGKYDLLYNDGGFIVSGNQYGELNASRNGWTRTEPGTTFYIKTKEGEAIAELIYNLDVASGNSAVGANSYTRIMNYLENNNTQMYTTKDKSPYPFKSDYDWSKSWSDGQTPPAGL